MENLTMNVRGVDYAVAFDTHTGEFRVVGTPDLTATSDTWDGLRREIIHKTRRAAARVAVPFVTETGQRGVATGIHASNSDVLVRWDDGRTDRLRPYYAQLRADTDVDELRRLMAAYESAVTTLRDFRRDHAMPLDLGPTVRAAIDAEETTGDE